MRLAAGLLALACGGVAFGDEAAIFVPTALAARVEGGERAGLSVSLEARPDGAVVWLNRAIQALPDAPAYPLAEPTRCGDPTALEVAPSFALPPELTGAPSQGDSAFDISARVVDFVSQRITLDEHDGGPQDGISVLARGRGRCSGRANLAVGLLPFRFPQGSCAASWLAGTGPAGTAGVRRGLGIWAGSPSIQVPRWVS
jgi:hypothetical protein